jgi:hypothetical protein
MYIRPEVTKSASSLEAIQSHGQKVAPSLVDNPLIATANAYEADE